MELVGPNFRVFGSVFINVVYAVFQALLGVFAIWFTNWRTLLRVLYTPAFLMFIYFWIVPESVRWLISKGRVKEAADVLIKVAQVNKKELRKETIEELKNLSVNEGPEKSELQNDASNVTVLEAFKHKTILLRFINCSCCWAANTFVYYGLSIISVSVGSDKYQSFIYVSLIEVPGLFCAWILGDRWGRIKTLVLTLFISGAACIITIFLDPKSTLNLIVFLIGKLGVTTSFAILYTYTAEIFPTPLRHTLLGMCSMFGRIGNMLAPQAPLLATVFKDLPMIVFAAAAILSGFFTIFMPETLNVELPATIEEAVQMSKKTHKRIK